MRTCHCLLFTGDLTSSPEVAPAPPDDWACPEEHGSDVLDLHRRLLHGEHLHAGPVGAESQSGSGRRAQQGFAAGTLISPLSLSPLLVVCRDHILSICGLGKVGGRVLMDTSSQVLRQRSGAV